MTLRKWGDTWKLKENALDCTLCRTCIGRGYGPVVQQTTEGMTMHALHSLNMVNPIRHYNPLICI